MMLTGARPVSLVVVTFHTRVQHAVGMACVWVEARIQVMALVHVIGRSLVPYVVIASLDTGTSSLAID